MNENKIIPKIYKIIFLTLIQNFDKFFNTASGQNGAVDADGGYLIPEEFLPLAELNLGGVDLRAIVTNVPVTTRSGKVPVVL